MDEIKFKGKVPCATEGAAREYGRVGRNESDGWQRDSRPDARVEYSTYPIVCYTSEPCVAITSEGRSAIAVYVWARKVTPMNNGSHEKWAGWVKIPDWNSWIKNPDWSFVENIYTGKTINVAKWKVLLPQLSKKLAEILPLEKQGEQKLNWSENDEKIYNRIYDLIHAAAYANYDVDEDGKELGEYAEIINWLTSLKERVQPQWNPSKEQMKQLKSAANIYPDSRLGYALRSLYQDLVTYQNNLKL